MAGTDEVPLLTRICGARMLLREEGILGGSSSGTLLAAALKYCRSQTVPKRVATAQLQMLRPVASMAQLRAILDAGLITVIADDAQFYGLITRFNLFNHLRSALS